MTKNILICLLIKDGYKIEITNITQLVIIIMHCTYKLRIIDRQKNDFGLVNAYTLADSPIPHKFNPIAHKMFNQDIFTYENGHVNILHSSARCMKVIPAVLALENSQTYGRMKDKFLYKCIPDDKRLPIFLVPYKIKLGFSKSIKNKYVVFQFRSWEGKHPIGSLPQTIGDVNQLDSFYEYQLYCKSLYASIQNITKKTMRKLKEKTEEEYIDMIKTKSDLKDYRDVRNILSIDPSTSRDFDDAFDIEKLEDGHRISIYISNVSFWMDAMDLWSSFSNRISTIYLPDRKRPMLPTVLSDALCSLTENIGTTTLYNASFSVNAITFLSSLIMYMYEVKRENTMINYLHVNDDVPTDNDEVGKVLVKLPEEKKNKILKLDKQYQLSSYITFLFFIVNSILSGITISEHYLDNKTLTVFVTNVLFMAGKLIDVSAITNTEINIFYSAYLKHRIQYNDVDPDKMVELMKT